MSIFSKLMSAISSRERPRPGVAPAGRAEPSHIIPIVNFDPERVTEAVKDDLKKNIKKIQEFDESHFDRIFDAALRSITRGRDLATLFSAIMESNLPNVTKQRASEISLSLNNKATARMNRDRQVSSGMKYATWVYSGAPCYVNQKKPSGCFSMAD